MERRYAIVGAGINGLCTAWQLARRVGGPAIVVFEQGQAGHTGGSSHGEERITRSSYASQVWVQRMQRAHAEEWPALELALGKRLLHRGGDAVFFGPEEGPIGAYAAAVREGGAEVEELDVIEARRRFPAFTFDDCERVLHDRTAGVIAAGETMRGLRAWLVEAGVEFGWGERVRRVDDAEGGAAIETERRLLRVEQVAVTAGPWVGALLPAWRTRVRPARQDVGYWKMPVKAGTFPAWVRLGPAGLHYGLPTIAGGEMKAAWHRTGAEMGEEEPGWDDPSLAFAPRRAALEEVGACLGRWFRPAPTERTREESCFYTNAPADDFLIERAVGVPAALVVSACSGHAFKLAPLTGRAVAERLIMQA